MSARKPALSAAETAQQLRIPVSTVFLLCRRGQLRGFRAGRHLRIRPEWVEEYIRSNELRTEPRSGAGCSSPGDGDVSDLP